MLAMRGWHVACCRCEVHAQQPANESDEAATFVLQRGKILAHTSIQTGSECNWDAAHIRKWSASLRPSVLAYNIRKIMGYSINGLHMHSWFMVILHCTRYARSCPTAIFPSICHAIQHNMLHPFFFFLLGTLLGCELFENQTAETQCGRRPICKRYFITRILRASILLHISMKRPDYISTSRQHPYRMFSQKHEKNDFRAPDCKHVISVLSILSIRSFKKQLNMQIFLFNIAWPLTVLPFFVRHMTNTAE